MPESPEVARSTDRLVRILSRNGVWMKLIGASKFGNVFDHVDLELIKPAGGYPIVDIFCKGKEYFLQLSNGVSLRGHHGMHGHWEFIHPNSTELPSHTHFKFDFLDERDGYTTSLLFINTRFGEFEIFSNYQQLLDSVSRIEMGFLGKFILSIEQWRENINGFTNRKVLRAALMNQKDLCSGIGNYLLAEVLWHAKLHPDITIGQLRQIPGGIDAMYQVCFYVVNGHYTRHLEKVIYNKKICPLGHAIEHPKKGGRTMWFCPTCQA